MESLNRWWAIILKKYQALPKIMQLLIGIGLLAVIMVGLFLFDSSPSSANTSTFSLGISVFLKLIVVILLIYLCAAFYRNWRGITGQAPVRQMAINETLHLNPRRAVHLIQVGDRQFLIGATDQNITLLAEIKAADGKEPDRLSPFSEVFASQFEGIQNSPSFKDGK
jgi:flagellar biosynthetic protein FliO